MELFLIRFLWLTFHLSTVTRLDSTASLGLQQGQKDIYRYIAFGLALRTSLFPRMTLINVNKSINLSFWILSGLLCLAPAWFSKVSGYWWESNPRWLTITVYKNVYYSYSIKYYSAGDKLSLSLEPSWVQGSEQGCVLTMLALLHED